MKIAAAGIVVPLMFIYSEALLLRFNDPPILIATQMISAILIVVLLGCFLTGYFIVKLNLLQMVMMGMGLAAAYSFFPTKNFLWFAAACVIFAMLTMWQLMGRRKKNKLRTAFSGTA